jgi:hypothetical protein
MINKVAVTKVREFRPHADHLHGARVFQKLAEGKVNGSYYQRVGCLAFCAFALEAYFNHLGQLTLSYWEEVEFASPLVKLRLLAAEFQVQFDASRRPLQTVIELFRYRNWLAHSRSERFTEESEHNAEAYEDTFYDTPLHRWEAFAALTNMTRAIEDAEAVITLLNAKSPNPELIPLAASSHSGSASPAREPAAGTPRAEDDEDEDVWSPKETD